MHVNNLSKREDGTAVLPAQPRWRRRHSLASLGVMRGQLSGEAAEAGLSLNTERDPDNKEE